MIWCLCWSHSSHACTVDPYKHWTFKGLTWSIFGKHKHYLLETVQNFMNWFVHMNVSDLYSELRTYWHHQGSFSDTGVKQPLDWSFISITCDNEPFPAVPQPVYRYVGFFSPAKPSQTNTVSQHVLRPCVITPCSRFQSVVEAWMSSFHLPRCRGSCWMDLDVPV